MKISQIGFGCYRTDISIEEHYNALFNALENGINVIDTSSNYFGGGSEELVAKVINDISQKNILMRENICLITKAGYIQSKLYKTLLEMEKDGRLFSDVVKLQDGLWHCISPDFLEYQLEIQLKRLQQNYIDIYLLHNPEYFLSLSKKNNIPLDEARNEYYRRIKSAFEFLEEKIGSGIIRSYGISSNTFVSNPDDYEFTSLENVISIAENISPSHNFKAVQFPFNLIESGAISVMNQKNKTCSVLRLAKKSNLQVFINRPLNAITSKGLVRFADFKFEAFSEKEFIKQMKLVSLMEDDLLKEKILNEDLSGDDKKTFAKLLDTGKLISENWKFFGSIEHFNDVVSQIFAPKISTLLKLKDDKIRDEAIKDFIDRYVKNVYLLLNFVSNYYKMRADKRSKFIHGLINKFLVPSLHGLTLSQKTFLILKSIDGVSCVLAGIRKDSYVIDALEILNENKILNATEIIEYVSKEIEYEKI